ncbi:carbon-nitrogen hydrolase family protein [Thermoplasma sp.]|uniref:carbon-nitrogen hydrolase family protein n=1 Tax=Thermoplasma sp. TaxID=1973142 RepID=UPI00263162E3|nr:carbon-nitrogen hydrolase family protein [Thermoplasma sp.]
MRILAVQLKIGSRDLNLNTYRYHIEDIFRRSQPGDFLIFPEETGLPMSLGHVIDKFGIEIDETADGGEFPKSSDAGTFRSIFLSVGEETRNSFLSFFSEMSRKYQVYALACGNIPEETETPRIYNTAYVFDTMGNVVFKQRKVYLTDLERNIGIDSGSMDDVRPFQLEGIKFGIAISLDAFMPDYISRLYESRVILQPDANDVKWNSFLENGRWQPEEWMDSSYYIAQRIPGVDYAVNPMMIGGFMGINFEGESAIIKKAMGTDERLSYVGNVPTTGFQDMIAPEGFDPHEFQRREDLVGLDLKLPEGVISVDIR